MVFTNPKIRTVFIQTASTYVITINAYPLCQPENPGDQSYCSSSSFRAILQSGTPLAYWAVNKNPYQGFYTLANQTGCLDGVVSSWTSSISYYFTSEAQKRAERERVLACLRRLDAKELIRPTPPDATSLTWVSVGLNL